MSPATHFLVSWLVANTAHLERRDRIVVTLAGIAPDLDGLGIVPEILTKHSSHPLAWFSQYHHVLGHNLGFGLLVTLVALLVAHRSWRTAGMAFLAFNIHLFCDVVGSRGPDGYQWPIPYCLPFSSRGEVTWQHQWALNAWPNFVITAVAVLLTIYLAWFRGFSPVEIFSMKGDRAFIAALRQRFGVPNGAVAIR
jgi:hypothetical protein